MCPIPTAMSLHCQCYRPITVAKGKVKYLVAIKRGNVYMPSLIHEFKLECDCDWFYLYLVTKFCVLICNCYKIRIIVRHNLYPMTKIVWIVLIVVIAHGYSHLQVKQYKINFNNQTVII